MKLKKSKCDTNTRIHSNDTNKFYVFRFLDFYVFKGGGQILLEVLIAIGLIAIIATLAMLFLQVGQRTTKESAQRTRAFELAAEAQEIVRSIAENDWKDVCDACLTATSTSCNPETPKEGYTTTTVCKIIVGDPYHPDPTSTGWMLAPSSTTVSSGNINFTRSVVIDNVCRCNDGTIEACQACPAVEEVIMCGETIFCTEGKLVGNDASTRKVTVNISAQGMEGVALVTYLTRWGKKDEQISPKPLSQIVYQSDWSGGQTTTPPVITRPTSSAITVMGNLFTDPWYQTASGTALIAGTEGLNFWGLIGSLFGEPQ